MNRKFIRLILGLCSLGVFILSVSKVGQYWAYEEVLVNVGEQITQNIAEDEFSIQIQESIDQGELEDAENFLEIAKEYQLEIDQSYFKSEIEKKDKLFSRLIQNSSDFAEGFIKGKGTNMAGVAGSVTADFTVIGDARDLRNEYMNYQEGKPVDELIVILSGIGVGLTALTVGSLGAASPVKTGASTIKQAVKSQSLSKTFQKQILKYGRQIFDWSVFTGVLKHNTSISNIRKAVTLAYKPKAIKPLKEMAGQVNNIRKLSSLSDSLFLLKYVDNANDLIHLEKAVIKYGDKTRVLFKMLGKSVIKTTKVLKKTAELFISIVSSIISGLFSLFLFVGRRFV